MKACDLPIYDEPQKTTVLLVPHEATRFEEQVSVVRKIVWKYGDEFKDVFDKIRDKYEIGKAHTQQTLHYIQEDSGTLPRAALITVAGLGGIVSGYRGGALRKAVFAGSAMVATASLCYPHQAVDISQLGWFKTKSQLASLYNNTLSGKAPAAIQKEVITTPKAVESAGASSSKDKPASAPASTVAVKEDFGMSKKEDQDMYSTRGS